MRKILYIASLIIMGGCSSVQRIPEGAGGNDNQVIIDYIDKNMGVKIKSGKCFDLVSEAMNLKYEWWTKNYYRNGWQMFKHRVYFERKVKAGDIVIFENVEMENGDYMKSHIAIIYKAVGDREFIIAEQNVLMKGQTTHKHSRVVLNEFNSKEKITGKVLYYRF